MLQSRTCILNKQILISFILFPPSPLLSLSYSISSTHMLPTPDNSSSCLSIFLTAELISPTPFLSAPFLPTVFSSLHPSLLINLPYLISYSLVTSHFILSCSFLHQGANKIVLHSTLHYSTLLCITLINTSTHLNSIHINPS
jgi:hypothetical protein